MSDRRHVVLLRRAMAHERAGHPAFSTLETLVVLNRFRRAGCAAGT